MSEEKSIKLQRRKAMKRKNFVRGRNSRGLPRILEPGCDGDTDSSEDDLKGSSLDLTPTLLGIYDKIASANQNGEEEPTDQSEYDCFVTNENLEDGSYDRCHSPELSPDLQRKAHDQSKFRELLHRPVGVKINVETFEDVKNNNYKLRMENAEPKAVAEADEDNKKRPLSISSMSSSSTSSWSRRRKRPNLSEHCESTTSSQLDIEKLDNLLYIDDGPGEGTPERSADELSMSSEDKRTSGGDSDSQISGDQSINEGDQSEPLDTTLSFHQSDSSLSFTPSNSANQSTTDLTSDPTVTVSQGQSNEKVKRSPSKSSQRSTSSRSGSVKQSTHYVSFVQRVVTELVETERTYVQHLKEIIQGYYEHILQAQRPLLSVADRECLFGNIVDIYKFSCEFLAELENCWMDPIKVADCFVKNSDGFVIYAEYCTNYPSAVDVLTKVMCDPELNEVFKERQLAMGHSLPLGAYLLKPVQRVLKYHLLLQNILKHYNDTDPGQDKLLTALEHMTNMSHEINEMKRKHEHAVRVQEIQSQLEDYEGEDFTRLGELVLEGSFRMFGVKASRQMFLFEKGVIIAKRKEDGMLSCKAYIPCAILMLVESIPREPLNFQLVPINNPRAAHTIHARNLDQKRKWCQEIKRLMLESFSSKIPDNVKDLIIEKLGQSKEEDAMVQRGTDSGKSHVSTPDYLEKRLRTRRKSGPSLISDMLKQRNRKLQQGKSRAETPSPKPLESMMYAKTTPRQSTTDADQFNYRRNKGVSLQEDQENQSPTSVKRPVSIQRSQSFQNSGRNSGKLDSYFKEQSNTDSISVDNLSRSDGSTIRTPSFRIATLVSPIKFDSLDGAVKQPNQEVDSVLTEVTGSQTNVDNILSSVRKSLDDIDGAGTKQDHPFSARERFFKDKVISQNLNGSYLNEMSSPKRGRYASMPVLNTEPLCSPKTARLNSEKSANSPTLNHIPKSNIYHAKRIDIKPYFSYSKDKINPMTSSQGGEGSTINGPNTLTKDLKHVTAFNDAFANFKKSQENISEAGRMPKSLSLTQPKPFCSTLKHSADLLQSQARLNKLGPERFTKGSMSDLSHLREDPWVPNKQRSNTMSESVRQQPDNKHTERMTEKPVPLATEKSLSKISHRQLGRLSVEARDIRHHRAQSFTCGENTSDSGENLDWIVYANRNSLPVSGLADGDLSRKYKYCTPPRGSMEPPPSSQHQVGDLTRTPQHQNVVASHSTPIYSSMGHSGFHGFSKEANTSNGDSTFSLSATNTSSDTCSSPDMLKDVVFDDTSSAEKNYTRDRSQLSRSFSSPEPKRSHFRKQHQEDRAASADMLDNASHIEESEKLVAEMERYLKHSTSSSGSLSSNNSKFPTTIPSFEKKHEHRNVNRDSCLSTGSASSYDSAGEATSEEGIVDSIKHKIHSITSKLTGKKMSTSDANMSRLGEVSTPSSPQHNKEDHPLKLSHNFSLRLKHGNQKQHVPDLPSLLREMEPGSEAIGSRMANSDLDDYATFSLPRTTESETADKKLPQEPRRLHYGRFSTSNLAGSRFSHLPAPCSKLQSQSESRLYQHAAPSLKNLTVAQSDSAFSIHSVDIDTSSSDDSPRNGSSQDPTAADDSAKKPFESDNFYEKRLSVALGSEDPFRDSAVYCDDLDTAPTASQAELPIPSKINIKSYVHQLEEKNKAKVAPAVKVKHKEPAAIIRQRMESLAAMSEYRSKSSSTSCSISSATSRTQSRCSSRASSEEKQMSASALHDYINSKFPSVFPDSKSAEDCKSEGAQGQLKPAYSMGRLDTLSMDVNNLVIMKGWVKELIEKFQSKT